MVAAMNDVERIWMEITGAPPRAQDAMAVTSVEAIITGSRRRVPGGEYAMSLVDGLKRMIWDVAALFDVEVPGEDDCECGGECPCHVLAKPESEG